MKYSKDLFICLIGCLITLTGCDDLSRFSYENYYCQPSLTSLYEIRVSQPKPGAFANILYAQDQSKAEITSLTKTQIIIESKSLRLIVDRQTGFTQVFKDNIYEGVSCVIDKFKM